jgi:hypothetical protein
MVKAIAPAAGTDDDDNDDDHDSGDEQKRVGVKLNDDSRIGGGGGVGEGLFGVMETGIIERGDGGAGQKIIES